MATDLIKQRLGALAYGVLRFFGTFRVLASLGESRIALVGFGLVATWALLGLLAPCPDTWLAARPVSLRVNDVQRDDARCIAPVASQGALF